MRWTLVASGVGPAISVVLLLTTVFGGAIWAMYLGFPGLWVTHVALGIAHIQLVMESGVDANFDGDLGMRRFMTRRVIS